MSDPTTNELPTTTNIGISDVIEKAFDAGFMAAVDEFCHEDATINAIAVALANAKRERLKHDVRDDGSRAAGSTGTQV